MSSTSTNVDSARMNLASSYVNGFVNAAFGQDKLLTEEGNKWIYKNKEHGKFFTLSAAENGFRHALRLHCWLFRFRLSRLIDFVFVPLATERFLITFYLFRVNNIRQKA